MGGELSLFMAQRAALAMTPADLDAVHRALAEASRRVNGVDRPIRYLHSTYLPSRQLWIGVFAATGPEAVHRTVEMAQLPTAEVTEAIELSCDAGRDDRYDA